MAKTSIFSSMNKDERIAYDYLLSINKNVIHEPNGKIPPDFSMDNKIAVEVRRLNQLSLKQNRAKGLEEDEIRLVMAIKSVLKDLDTKGYKGKYWINLYFFRPIGHLRDIKDRALAELTEFLKKKMLTPHEIQLSANVKITVVKSEHHSPGVFEIGLISDQENGGFVVPIYLESINWCLMEKTRKIQDVRTRYKEWWLLLIDYLVCEISETERTIIRRGIKMNEDWSRIIVFNPEVKRKVLVIDNQ